MPYLLECEQEFERLERQSRTKAYDIAGEIGTLSRLGPGKDWQKICDAGCGSGILSRHLAELFPKARIVGADASKPRIEQARIAARRIPNLRFEVADILTETNPLGDGFDCIIVRYVLQHLGAEKARDAIWNLKARLKPGGELWVIDIDGLFYNVYPTSPSLLAGFERMRATSSLDLEVGRKIPYLMADEGFTQIRSMVQAMNFTGEALREEQTRIAERFDNARPFFEKTLGGPEKAEQFRTEYLRTLESRGATLFYNKFLIRGLI